MLNVSGRVKKALFDKGWTQKKLCGEIDVTETGFKRMAENNTWKLETLEKISTVLDLPIVYFFDDSQIDAPDHTKVISGDDYLKELITKLETSFTNLSEQFATQLSAKDNQIAGLQRMLESVLGKSKGATSTQLSEEEMFSLTMDAYRQSGLSQVFSPVVSQPRKFNVPMLAKSVALSSL